MQFVPLFIIIVVVVFIIKVIGRFKYEDFDEVEHIEHYPYHRRQYLMSAAEYDFFKVLQEAVHDSYYIVPQVVLSNLVDVNDNYKWNKSFRSKIDKKTIDFVLFNKAGYTPYLAIELNDRSHLHSDRMERDEFVSEVLSTAGIKLITIPNSSSYNVSEIISTIHPSS